MAGLAVRTAGLPAHMAAVRTAVVHTVDLVVRMAAARTVGLAVRMAAVHTADLAVRMAAAHTAGLPAPVDCMAAAHMAGLPGSVPTHPAVGSPVPPTAQPDFCNFHHDSYPSFPPFRSATNCSASRTLPHKFLFFPSFSSNNIRKCCKLLKRQSLPTHSQRHSKLRDTLLNDFLRKLKLRKIMKTVYQRFSALIK